MEVTVMDSVDVSAAIELLEARMVILGGVRQKNPGESHPDMPMRHLFAPGLYAREIFMPAGMVVTTKIHLTEHFFIVSKGAARVFHEGEGWVRIEAPYFGRTECGTRRVLLIEEDMIWTTFHATDMTDVAEIEMEIFETPPNELIPLAEHAMACLVEGGLA